MTFELKFIPQAKKEWRKLAPTIKAQFTKKLAERLENPHVPSARLSGSTNRYKIKLRAVGYRLVYEVVDDVLIVYVIAVGKRENNHVYDMMAQRELELDETNSDDNLQDKE
ncbi:type II toxin-antitoxin system RelE/ParE family toxin [Moraxella canis]|uniref:Type II toxin-antitoxin system RelE/ParE family toxin n=1 Tax=Moraxella canis TaxID=90239 RepID=A0ABZ0X075_9GAMM|nr:type II toxin-antitoxin system RelE/ParE family toxin [Moraxella canis]WQE04899.1 type II toxin-antitoxin system RelE/ParE family toxin [Moraxella canis]